MLMIDGHLDLAMNALLCERDQTLTVQQIRERESEGVPDDRGTAMVSLPTLRQAGVCVVVATLIARAKPWVEAKRVQRRDCLDYPDASMAYAMAHGQLAYYRLLESQGHLRIITTKQQLQEHLAQWQDVSIEPPPVGVILLMEGADPIVEPAQVAQWADDGVRVLGLAHFGHGRYAAGTPSPDPASFEQDGPLTPLGRELLQRMNELPIVLDLTHLADTSFFQAMEIYEGPVCASHCNCRALAPTPRQLTDDQIRLIVQRDGVVGVVFYKGMICWPGENPKREAVRLKHVVEHIDHLCQLAGSAKHVAMGTDLDGGFGREAVPADLQEYADLHQFAQLLADRGFSDDDIAGFFHGNWARFYLRHLPDQET